MKKLVLLILGIVLCTTANARDINTSTMLLKCDRPKGYVENRLSNISYSLVDSTKWRIVNNTAYYFVAFGQGWEDIEKSCYAHTTYIEKATYKRVMPYMDGNSCQEGLFFKGKQEFRDSWGGLFMINTNNSFNPTTNSCHITSTFTSLEESARREKWSYRKTCDNAKRHFLNTITDYAYNSKLGAVEWQKAGCKEISLRKFEEETGLTVKILNDTLAKDVI